MTWAASLALAVLASAVMLVLALPLGEQGYLGWFVFVPVIRAVRGRGFLVGFAVGLASIFMAAWLSVQGWLYRVHDPGGSPAWVYTGFGIFGFSVCMSIGAWGDSATKSFRTWWFAAFAVLLEAYLLVQLPAHLALSQYRNEVLLQVAAIGGVWMLSFLLWWTNFAIASLPLRLLIPAACLVAAASVALNQIHWTTAGRTALIGIIQIAEPEEDSLTKLQKDISRKHPDFVVWPEFGGIPFVQFGAPDRLAALTRTSDFAPIVTSYPDDHRPLPHNASTVFAHGKVSALYYKRRLFGGESKMHFPGELAAAAPYSQGTVGLNICFDSCYPEIIRDTARLPGVNVITLPSIDPFATNHFISAIHAAYSPIRCAENGVSMVKADGLAFSLFVDPYGQIISELPPGDQVALQRVPLKTHWTPYRQFGDWFLLVCGALFAVPLGKEVLKAIRCKFDSKSGKDG